MDLNGTSAIVTGGASGLGRGHLPPAGRARRPRGRGRPPGGQGRAAGQGDRRALRPDRRHQHRAGDRRRRGRHRDGAAQVAGQLRRHRLGHPHHRQGRRLRLGARPRPVPPGDRDQPHRHLQLHPPGRHQDEPQRARRGRRPRRHREHGVGGGRGRADRAGRLLVVEGRRRRHDPPGGPRPGRGRHPGQHASCRG